MLERLSNRILVSDGPEIVSIHRDLSDIPGFAWLIGVENSDSIYLINLYDGLWSIKSSGNTLLYDDTQVLGGNNCGSESFAVSHNGSFAYIPGCNPTPLVGGLLDGTGPSILATEDDFDINQNLSLSSVTRNPDGGYMVALGGPDRGPIAHVYGNGDWSYLPLEPDLAATGLAMEGSEYALYQRPIAVGPSGRIYACSRTTLYVANKIIREVNVP
jgi:hypothetical protein